MKSALLFCFSLLGWGLGLIWSGQLQAQPVPRSTQPFCGTNDLTPAQARDFRQQAMQALWQKKRLRTTSASITYVPIRPHIVRRSDGTEGFDLTSLNIAMAATNRHFLSNGSGIQFYFAGTTPDYINNDTWYYNFPGGTYDPAIDSYDVHNALNQYYVNGLDSHVAGVAGMPSNNVISTRSAIKVYGLTLQYVSDQVIPHELGHTFGLLHTFGPGPAVDVTSELVTRGAGANCETAGDEICDTPADPYTTQNSNYDPNNPPLDANGDAFMPSLTNIMSYYISLGLNNFTPGQYNRMQAGLALRQTHTAYTLDYLPTNVVPVSNLTATSNGVSVLLTWQDNATNEMGYFIERSTSPSIGFIPIGGVGPDATTFRDNQTTPLTQYYYRVRPSNSTTDNLSSTVSITTPNVPMVTGLMTSNITGSTALLSWDSIGDGATYELRWRPVGATDWSTASTTESSYAVGLVSNTTYEWQVRAKGGTTYTGSVYFTTLCPAPVSPSSNPSRVTASLTWSSNISTYAVRWRKVGDATWNTINNITSTSYLLTGLMAQTAYEWQVQSVCSATVSSDFTANQSFTTVACQNPYYAYTNGARSSSVDISWSSPNDDPGRTTEIRYRVVGAPTWIIIGGITSSSTISYTYPLTGLANNTTYEWQLRNNCSTTETSDYTSLATFTTTCRIPTNLSNGIVTATQALFSWSVNSPVDAGITFELNYRLVGASTWTSVGGITGPSSIVTYSLTGLTTNTQYEWRVRTICSVGAQSDYSASRLFTTFCNAPNANGLTASLVTSTSVQLNWNTLNDPNTSYTIRYRPVGAADWISVTTSNPNMSGGSCVLTGLTNNTTYEWQLQSMCSPTQLSGFIAGPNFTTQCREPLYSYSSPMLSSVILTWQPVGTDITYDVRYRALGATEWTNVTNITSASALITGLVVNLGYEWGVRVHCQDGIVTDYLAAAFATQTCGAPLGLQTTLITANSARLTWYFSYASPDTRFEARYRAIGTLNWTSIPNLTITNSTGFADVSGLSPDTQYQWQIRSICSSTENSSFSSPVSFRTLAPCLSMYTIRSGLWNDAAVWSCGRVPLSSDAVQLKHTITIPATYQALALRITYDVGQQLIFSAGSTIRFGQ